MRTATIHELKKELDNYSQKELRDLCLRLAKHRKDSKELLTYLLFEASNEAQYIQSIKSELDEEMGTINRANVYWTKKGLRRILRRLDKLIRYSANKETEVDLRIYFCQKVKDAHIPLEQSKVLSNLYERQVIKIDKALATLHEDLQYDYQRMLERLA